MEQKHLFLNYIFALLSRSFSLICLSLFHIFEYFHSLLKFQLYLRRDCLTKNRQIILQIFANLFHEFILNLNFVKIVTDDD